MAVGSFVEEYSNQIQIIQLKKDSQGNGSFHKLCTFEHPYPPTKIMWAPTKHNLTTKDLLATTGDYLRLWTVDSENSVEMKGVLNNNKNAGEFLPAASSGICRSLMFSPLFQSTVHR